MNKLFIGIDVSSKDLQVAITDSESHQTPLVNESFSNDLVRASEIKEVILDLAQKNRKHPIARYLSTAGQ